MHQGRNAIDGTQGDRISTNIRNHIIKWTGRVSLSRSTPKIWEAVRGIPVKVSKGPSRACTYRNGLNRKQNIPKNYRVPAIITAVFELISDITRAIVVGNIGRPGQGALDKVPSYLASPRRGWATTGIDRSICASRNGSAAGRVHQFIVCCRRQIQMIGIRTAGSALIHDHNGCRMAVISQHRAGATSGAVFPASGINRRVVVLIEHIPVHSAGTQRGGI